MRWHQTLELSFRHANSTLRGYNGKTEFFKVVLVSVGCHYDHIVLLEHGSHRPPKMTPGAAFWSLPI